MKNLSHTLSCIKKDVYISFVISFVCLVVILLILSVIPLWGSATVHSHSGKELNPFSKENAHFSGRCTSTKLILLYPALFPFGTQQQLTHPPVKGSSFRLRKMSVFQGVAPRHTIFTSYCVIPLWDSATAHSTSSKELNTLPLRKMPRALYLGIQFLFHPAPFLFGTQQQLTLPLVKSSTLSLWNNNVSLGLVWYSPILFFKSICVFILYVVYFYSERPPLYEIFHFIFGLFL